MRIVNIVIIQHGVAYKARIDFSRRRLKDIFCVFQIEEKKIIIIRGKRILFIVVVVVVFFFFFFFLILAREATSYIRSSAETTQFLSLIKT